MSNRDETTNDLTPKQEAFITALLTAPTMLEAAATAGISIRTARRWFKLPQVQEEYNHARRETFNTGLEEIKSVVSLAARTLKKHLTNEDTPPAVQVRAAEIIIKQAIEAYTTQEQETRIAELEELVKGNLPS